jgi:hypothetical protein
MPTAVSKYILLSDINVNIGLEGTKVRKLKNRGSEAHYKGRQE